MSYSITLYLDKIRKDSISIEYQTDMDRFEIRSEDNIDFFKNNLDVYFSKKKKNIIITGKESSETETKSIGIIEISSKLYLDILEKIGEFCGQKHEAISIELLKKYGEIESENLIDSFIEILQFRRFVSKYYSVRKDKKYREYCYFLMLD